MELLRMPAKRPEYRANRPHADFIRGLAAAGVQDRGSLIASLLGAAAARLELTEVGLEETDAAMAAPHRKSTCSVDLDNIDR